MGRHFRVGCGSFSWGGGEGEEDSPGQLLQSRVRRRRAGSNGPIVYCLLYIAQWKFRCCMLQPSRKVPSILEALGSARALFRLRQPVDLDTH